MADGDAKLITLLHRVYENSQTAKLQWEPTSDANVFSVAAGDYTLMLERMPAEQDSPEAYSFRISNDDGQVIAEITDAQAKAAGFDKMETIFKLARRFALNFDQAIDEVLRALGENPSRK